MLLNMDVTRKRLEHMRRDPRVSLTVLEQDDWYTHVTLFGVVEQLEDDPDLADSTGSRSAAEAARSGAARARG